MYNGTHPTEKVTIETKLSTSQIYTDLSTRFRDYIVFKLLDKTKPRTWMDAYREILRHHVDY